MDKRIKIALGVVILLAVLSGAFLIFAKKKPASTPASKTVQASAPVKSLTPAVQPQNNNLQQKTQTSAQSAAVDNKIADRKAQIRMQWTQCKSKTLALNTNLFWNVQITEGIPAKGTYAKGNLDGDTAFPIHVIVKSDSQLVDKINAMLVVGKTAFLRGTCTDVATDGSVVLQAF